MKYIFIYNLCLIIFIFVNKINTQRLRKINNDNNNGNINKNSINLQLGLQSQTQSITDEPIFDLRLIGVDSSKAQFEIQDDNKTTINYNIEYTVVNTEPADPRHKSLRSGQIKTNGAFQMQTNSIYLLNKQLNLSNILNNKIDDSINSDKSGENYDSKEILEIKTKPYEEVHRFIISDLEQNKFYFANITIKAKQAHLKLDILPNQDISNLKEIEKTFQFKFKTSFDYDLTVSLACNNSKNDSDSCYVKDSECTKCIPTCYQVTSTTKSKNEVQNKAVLCEPCPCDIFRSTGECVLLDQSDKKESNFQPDVIKCKKCSIPYTGLLCNECENDGIDYYKNEIGECAKCECNNNALLDTQNYPQSSLNSLKKRKCQAITGNCIDCMYNTSGKHCHECKPGFSGDAMKRTCKPIDTKVTDINSQSFELNRTKTTQILPATQLIQKYSYKTLALFSLYIFCVLFLILLTFLCIKAKYHRDNVLKNDSMASNTFCSRINGVFDSLNESTRHYRNRISFYLTSLCPTLSKFRSVNLTSNGSNSTGIYNRANNGINDDDRVNLAEYQVFDDSLLVNDDHQNYIYRANFSDNDDINAAKNPYRSLTIKS